jgi:exodeoxyribonuclease VII large subunit
MSIYLNNKKFLFREINAKLHALNPNAILDRGYSIVRTIPEAIVVRDPRAIDIGQDLEITVARGKLICRVKGK